MILRVWARAAVTAAFILVPLVIATPFFATPFFQDAAPKPAPPADNTPQATPHHDKIFSGSIVELTSEKLTVSRSTLGKPAQKHTFWLKPDTKIEGGPLRVKARVTVGFVTSEQGDVARLIVVRTGQKKPDTKNSDFHSPEFQPHAPASAGTAIPL